jgi:hypothetical protein
MPWDDWDDYAEVAHPSPLLSTLRDGRLDP